LKNSEIEGGVSITLVPSNSSDIIFEYKALAPNWRLWDNFKKKKISEKKFIIEYQSMLNELNSKHVIEHLNFLTGGLEPILMCNCAKTKFCHRHLVADWLENETGIIINELNFPEYSRKNGYLVKKKNLSLFPD
jgi:uncharacterized protein YeaO (DUF488 family)